MNNKQFRRYVAEMFPLALACNGTFFAILSLSYFQERDTLVGVFALVFGAILIAGIFLVPARKARRE